MQTRIRLLAVVALLVSAAVAPSAQSQPSASQVLAVPGRSNAYATIAADGPFAAIAWGATKDGTTDVYAAVSRDGGGTFTAPVALSDASSRANLAGEQPPRVALVPRNGSGPTVVVVWTTRATAGTRLVEARSGDGGRTFGRPSMVPGTEAPGNRGWQSIAVDRDGRVVVTWLDHRALAPRAPAATGAAPAPAHDHAMPADADGVARAQQSALYVAFAGDPASARSLTSGVCYCCKTSTAVGADGAIYAAWRHVYAGNLRDIALTVSRDRGRTFSTPARVSEDGWSINGCPENGPALAVERQGTVHVVWPTVVTEAGRESMRIYHATSADGQRFTPRRAIPTEDTPRHVQMAFGATGNPALVWDEGASGTRRVVLGAGTRGADGSVRFARRLVGAGTQETYPVIASTPDGLAVAWTSGPAESSVIRVVSVH